MNSSNRAVSPPRRPGGCQDVVEPFQFDNFALQAARIVNLVHYFEGVVLLEWLPRYRFRWRRIQRWRLL